jgi:hypothetical protein
MDRQGNTVILVGGRQVFKGAPVTVRFFKFQV